MQTFIQQQMNKTNQVHGEILQNLPRYPSKSVGNPSNGKRLFASLKKKTLIHL